MIKYFSSGFFNKRIEKNICGTRFYPIHLDEIELSEIVSALLLLNDHDKTEIKVSKTIDGLGVSFLLTYYFREKEKYYKTKWLSFSINSNWEIIDFFDHWFAYGKKPSPDNVCSEQVTFHLEIIEKIIETRVKFKKITPVNRSITYLPKTIFLRELKNI